MLKRETRSGRGHQDEIHRAFAINYVSTITQLAEHCWRQRRRLTAATHRHKYKQRRVQAGDAWLKWLEHHQPEDERQPTAARYYQQHGMGRGE